MQKPTVGIIGHGVLGSAISHGFGLSATLKIYDQNPLKSIDTMEDVCQSELVFLCLPSPMKRKDGGGTDLAIIESVCKKLATYEYTKPIYVLKSTVPIGTTQRLNNEYGIKIVHSPEFLTSRNAIIDFLSATRTIIGGRTDWVEPVAKLFKDRFPGQSIMAMSSDESEAVKYVINSFFAVKVLFFNEVKLGLEKAYNLDWNKVLGGVLTDGRIGISHYQVPGHDGKLGVGGLCLAKDLCSIIDQIENTGFDPFMLKACWEQNKKLRPEMDWAEVPGAVSNTN